MNEPRSVHDLGIASYLIIPEVSQSNCKVGPERARGADEIFWPANHWYPQVDQAAAISRRLPQHSWTAVFAEYQQTVSQAGPQHDYAGETLSASTFARPGPTSGVLGQGTAALTPTVNAGR